MYGTVTDRRRIIGFKRKCRSHILSHTYRCAALHCAALRHSSLIRLRLSRPLIDRSEGKQRVRLILTKFGPLLRPVNIIYIGARVAPRRAITRERVTVRCSAMNEAAKNAR